MLVEARRVLRPGGCLVLIDVTSASREPVTVGASSYHPAERLLETLTDCGFAVGDHAAGHTRLHDWALADHEIAREIARTRRGEAGFEQWLDDRRRLERLMHSDRVLMFGVCARST
jgi:hypothetical protein